MRNFGEDTFFSKKIIIKENIEEKKNTEEINKPEIKLDFFPEGGTKASTNFNEEWFSLKGERPLFIKAGIEIKP